ncbi:unnamed protein product, partial [Musa acuminata subsp. burmannicoides]
MRSPANPPKLSIYTTTNQVHCGLPALVRLPLCEPLPVRHDEAGPRNPPYDGPVVPRPRRRVGQRLVRAADLQEVRPLARRRCVRVEPLGHGPIRRLDLPRRRRLPHPQHLVQARRCPAPPRSRGHLRHHPPLGRDAPCRGERDPGEDDRSRHGRSDQVKREQEQWRVFVRLEHGSE